ncbi:hypothetical protein GCM10025875_23300 [Litorihabitans aurantiacus]|uniref:Glycosyltransferase 2-like domain-containing protein n=1 Tax=Litorihabitans aurantiacus TaxID=1930061 RepID=A0AA37XF94_9MICO|nr:hypothetical protein GCM10025875_23300 [Litorihabitans aurantiacus]
MVVPTYDEIENLPVMLERLHAAAPQAHVLVVDDGSPDGTGTLAQERADATDWVHVLHRTEKAGLGAAYLAGFAWALARDYDAVMEMDADLSHHPEDVPRLLAALADADVVLGSRWVPGGGVENWPLHRRILSRGGSFVARLALEMPLRDATGGSAPTAATRWSASTCRPSRRRGMYSRSSSPTVRSRPASRWSRCRSRSPSVSTA